MKIRPKRPLFTPSPGAAIFCGRANFHSPLRIGLLGRANFHSPLRIGLLGRANFHSPLRDGGVRFFLRFGCGQSVVPWSCAMPCTGGLHPPAANKHSAPHRSSGRIFIRPYGTVPSDLSCNLVVENSWPRDPAPCLVRADYIRPPRLARCTYIFRPVRRPIYCCLVVADFWFHGPQARDGIYSTGVCVITCA